MIALWGGLSSGTMARMRVVDEPSSWVGGDTEVRHHSDGKESALASTDSSGYYPENLSMLRAELIVRHREFADLREQYLLGFGYHTARAYWADLENFYDWCERSGVDILSPGSHQIKNYLDDLLAEQFSPNTVARRLTSLRGFYQMLVDFDIIEFSPTIGIRPIARRRRAIRHA